jgi:dihydroorotate dehydrogenase
MHKLLLKVSKIIDAKTLARIERKSRSTLTKLPPWLAIAIYSRGRRHFLSKLVEEDPEPYIPPKELERTLWGIPFRSPIFNAAGMFKNGEGHTLTLNQGAAAHLVGTTTANERLGNKRRLIRTPFIPYPLSHSASNWLGLPNYGDERVAQEVRSIEQTRGFPTGASVITSPDLEGEEKRIRLIRGMHKYAQAGINFIELNESCPNVQHDNHDYKDLRVRLEYIRNNFLNHRSKKLPPVIVKFSLDTLTEQVPLLLDLLFKLDYDGINIGNTSTQYEKIREHLEPGERELYDYFTQKFGGGVSGRPLKDISLSLSARAVDYRNAGPPSQEFHVIRTGGIETAEDLIASDQAGISINQWFTGYFEGFTNNGHGVYQHLYEDYIRELTKKQRKID